MASPTSLRSPAPPPTHQHQHQQQQQPSSPLHSRRDESGTATPSWTKGRPLSASNALAVTDEGAAELSTRRRQSSSFKTMTTGSLVSNSPFARLGTVTSPTVPNRGSLYSTQRAPVVPGPVPAAENDSSVHKTNGSRSTIPAERDPQPKENRRASANGEQDLALAAAGSTGASDDKRGSRDFTPIVLAPRALGSPAVPFRPVRPQSASINNTTAARLAPDYEPARRASDSASERDSSTPSRPLPTAPRLSPNPSPYGIASLAKESPLLHDYPLESETDDEGPVRTVKHKTSASIIGLGVRPSPVPGDRRIIAGASAPPPATPPQDRQRTPSQSGSPSPSSALSPSRRGIRGPRAPLDADNGSDTEKEDDDAAEHRRVLRRQASTKTVRWAETEEVLEFEVDEERRRSQASSNSSSDGDRSYENDNDNENNDSNASLGFEEGGSVEVHDIDDSYGSEDDASAVSSGSGVEDLVDTIDSFMAEDELRTDPGDVFNEDRGSHGGRNLSYDDRQHHHPHAPQSAFSSSSASTVSSGTRDDDTTSDSSYDDDEELAQATKAHSALDQVELTFQLTSPPTSPPVPSSLPTPSLNLATPTPYALPALPDNSPFLGFADDGGASSVVSMDLARSSVPTTEPLMSPRIPTTSTPTRATPTNSSASPGLIHPADFSPILSAFADYSEPPAPLSREVSLVGSDYRASLRGGRLAAGKEAFEEKLRRQQAILESFDARPPALSQPSSRAVTTAPPATSSPHLTDVSVMSPPLASFPDPPRLAIPPASKAIPARPALRTASNSHLSAPSSPVATSSMQFGMDSPLERLSREVEGGQQAWSGVQPSMSMASVASNESAMAVREREIIERKRSLKEKNGRTRPRRSLSTGDVPQMTVRTDGIDSIPMEKRVTMPEFGVLNTLEPISIGAGPSFMSGAESELDAVYRQRNSSYRIRESKTVVYANDGEVATVGTAGDVDPGRAWRKKRPSDMNLPNVQSMRSISTSKSSAKPVGQTFIRIIEFVFDRNGFPAPQNPTSVECSVRQDSQASVKVGSFALGTTIPIDKEFELSKTVPLEIVLKIPIDGSTNRHLLPPAPTVAPPPKSPSRFRNLLSSPKKKPASPLIPAPERIVQYIGTDMVFASTQLNVAAHVARCRGKAVRIPLPIATGATSSQRAVAGSVVLEVLWIPPLGQVAPLPKSIADARAGIAAAEAETTVVLETVLTQLGGDCHTWRRRVCKLVGHRLIPYSEVTKRAMVEIDLSLAEAVFDPDAIPSTPLSPATAVTRTSSVEIEEGRWTTNDNAFLIIFRNGSEIEFFADSAEDKERWIAVLGTVVGRKARRAAPEWALRFKKLTVDPTSVSVSESA